MHEKRELVLDAARARFERFGVKKTTMDEIAGDASISKKTLYELFKNKEDLFVAVFIREALRNRDFIVQQIQHLDGALEQIERAIRGAVGRQWQQNFMIKVLQDQDGLYAPFLREKYRLQVEEEILKLFASMIERGIAEGKVRPMDSHTISYFLFKLFQSITFAKTGSLDGDERTWTF